MIKNHRYVGAKDAPSPNFTNVTITPVFIVMHYTAAWDIESTLSTFSNPASDVSAQFTIDVDGTIYQHVDCNKRAWHAGPSEFQGIDGLNSHSIGIEFVNPGFLRKIGENKYQDWHKFVVDGDSIAPLVEAKSERAGSGMFYWPTYSEAQLVSGENLTKALIEAYPIRAITTHEEIDKRGWKVDPGPAFPMNRFVALLPDRAQDVLQYEVTANSLNMRSGPSATSSIVGKLAKGTDVTAHESKGDWVRIGAKVWVHSAYLRPVR